MGIQSDFSLNKLRLKKPNDKLIHINTLETDFYEMSIEQVHINWPKPNVIRKGPDNILCYFRNIPLKIQNETKEIINHEYNKTLFRADGPGGPWLPKVLQIQDGG